MCGDVFCLGTCFVCRAFPSETRLCGERDCGSLMLNRERLVFESGKLEIERNSASSVATTQVRPSSVGDGREEEEC